VGRNDSGHERVWSGMTGPMLSRRTLVQTLVFAGLAVGSGLSLSGCGQGSGNGDGDGDGGGDVARADVERVAMGTDRTAGSEMFAAFAGGLLGQVLAREKGNAVFSPWSITVAMAMNRAGAAGQTAAEIDTGMRVPATPAGFLDAAVNTGAQLLDSRNETVETQERSGEVALRSANSAWARPDVTWKPAYLETLGRYYGAGVRLTDFGADPEGSRQRINAWVADHTEGRITDLVPPGAIDTLTALAVVNAVYFKAPWAEKFEKDATRPGPFTTSEGAVRQASMMRRLAEEATGHRGDLWQAATLPYLGGKVAMTVVLPSEGKEQAVGQWLSTGGIAQLLASRGEPVVGLTMPKFQFRTSVALKEVLEALGIKQAFLPDVADYSGMTDDADLYISAALHQATIAVDEEGTEATAATAIIAGATSIPVPSLTLVLDRPFFFVIHDVESRIPIFLGRVADPTQTS
jgi:serpin B